MDYSFLLPEIGIILLFLGCVIYVSKYDRKYINLLLFATLYAIIFENFNILLSHGKTGGYYYNKNFTFFLFNLPLFVALSWGIIIYTSKRIADSLPMKEFSKIFAASLLVLLVDLAIDVVAIRLDYWTWIKYSFTEGFFGVPANNFIGWLLISFTFFLLIYVFEKNNFGKVNLFKYFIATIASYFLFLIIFTPINFIETSFNLSKSQEFYILLILISVFLLFIKFDKRVKYEKVSLLVYIFRIPFYVFGLAIILAKKIYLENILLLIFSLFFILLELLLIKLEVFGRNENKRKNTK